MPFFTEHLWRQASNILKNNTLKINKSEWPKTINVDEKDNNKINLLIELISSIRSTRSEMNVPANSLIEVNFADISENLANIFDEYNYFMKRVLNTKKFNLDEESFFVEFKNKILNV